jgi:glutaminyl-peptide cyclotransferase
MPSNPFIFLPLAFLGAGCARDNQSSQPVKVDRPASHATMTTPSIPAASGTRAFGFLTAQTEFGPRNPNSRGHDACLMYLTSKLAELADKVTRQDFTHEGYGGEVLNLTNVVASFRPKEKARILLCAHWDTRPRADQDPDRSLRDRPILGANDGASGVAVLLELATLFKQSPPPVGVDLVLFDGEDYGKESDHALYFLGSRYYASQKRMDQPPRFGILLDMVGDKFLDLPIEQYSQKYAPDVVDLVWKTAARLGYPQFDPTPGNEVLDDHLPLNEAGIRTIDIIDFNYPDPTNRFWHTHQDIPENCSRESLEAVANVLANVVYAQVP